jgi:tetratricopeptide (TPR) repeat protein
MKPICRRILLRGCAVLCVAWVTAVSLGAQSSVAELNEAGWNLLNQGDGARAAQMFTRALALQPDEPVLLFGASVASHVQGHTQEAKKTLRRAIEIAPRFTPASLLLSEIVYGEGDLDQAIRICEQALKAAPGNADLTARLDAWRHEADVHRTFTERRDDRFRVQFEGRAEAELATHVVDVLSNEFWKIGEGLGAYPSDSIVVILYTEQQFRDITRAPEWSAGLYDGRIRVPVAGAAQNPGLLDRILVHELTHAMVTALAPRGVPTWLHEGLAQHFEGKSAEAARRRLQSHGARIPLEELERRFSDLTTAGAAVAYDESLVAVDTMLQRPQFTWAQLLYALSTGVGTAGTLERFGVTYADLDAALQVPRTQ